MGLRIKLFSLVLEPRASATAAGMGSTAKERWLCVWVRVQMCVCVCVCLPGFTEEMLSWKRQ